MPAIPRRSSTWPIQTREVQGAESWRLYVVRLTYQASARNKFNIHWDEQHPCNGSTFGTTGDGCRNQPESGAVYGPLGLGGLSSTTSPETGGYLYDHPRVRLLTWSSPVTNRLLFEAGFGAYQAPFGPYESPGNTTRGLARVTEQCAAGCSAQRRHPEPDISLGELGTQLGRAVHMERLHVVRDGRPQPEDRVRRRGARLRSGESHERSQPRVHPQQRARRSRSRRACCRSPRAIGRATCPSTFRTSGRTDA